MGLFMQTLNGKAARRDPSSKLPTDMEITDYELNMETFTIVFEVTSAEWASNKDLQWTWRYDIIEKDSIKLPGQLWVDAQEVSTKTPETGGAQ
jgi:hypothetical protein